ncbi:ABC transporter permease [Nocardia xishanensis]
MTAPAPVAAPPPTAVAPFVRCFVSDYFRNPVNLIVLVLVPAVFVLVAAGSIAQAMELLGRSLGSRPAVETATAGWAAAFLAGVAMYFQVRSARATDRRLVLAGLSPVGLVGARATTGLALAVLVSTVSLLALAARAGIDDPVRVIPATLMFAVIYLAIGAVVGILAGNPVNGAVVILFVWIIDVFIGQVGDTTEQISRWFPTHFVARWMVGLPTGHAGRLGDLGASLVWVTAAVLIAAAALVASSRIARPTRRAAGQLRTGLRLGVVELSRNPVFAVLLIVVPVVFVLLAKITTPARSMVLTLRENSAAVTMSFWFPEVHAGTMTPIAIGSLATLAGLFLVLDTADGDRRLRLAGYRAGVLLTARLGVIAVAVLVVTAAALAITATVFDARNWAGYAAANLLLAATYALIGVIIGPLFGRVAGVFVAFLIPFLDLGLIQSPMLRPEPQPWARAMPGYGASRVLFDTALTDHFDEIEALLIALVWFIGLAAVAALLYTRGYPSRRSNRIGSSSALA